ncbi:MAG: type 1 glutamine amidotransferase [Candidatus Puniceispirillaceae bacterium]
MTKTIAIIEGNHAGLVRQEKGACFGAAESFAACLSDIKSDLQFTIIRPHFSDHIYHDSLFDECDAVIFTGSANAWSADDKEAEPARRIMALALGSKKPVFGSCYGLQLAVTVLGGANRANPVETEFAIARHITINETGKTHPLYHTKPDRFHARCMHRDEVARLPKGAITLSANDHSDHQAVIYETDEVRFWGVQYHPELRFSDIADYMARNDVKSFADAKRFADRLSVNADLDDIMADFHLLDNPQVTTQDYHRLIAKYQLDDSLLSDKTHRCELVNFLAIL